MNKLDFYNLHMCWSDFVTSLSQVRLIEITNHENRNEWGKLLDYFTLVKVNGGRQQDLITESMADSLHKCMAIACTHHLVRVIEVSCPGWPWLLMEVDKQVAKRKGIHYGMDVEWMGDRVNTKMRSTDVRMLLEQLNPGHSI